MAHEYLKRATPPTATIDTATGETVRHMLDDIKRNGRDAVERYARDLDGYHGKVVLDAADFAAAAKQVPQSATISRLPTSGCANLRWRNAPHWANSRKNFCRGW
jgi:histidinol dehydrogenase